MKKLIFAIFTAMLLCMSCEEVYYSQMVVYRTNNSSVGTSLHAVDYYNGKTYTVESTDSADVNVKIGAVIPITVTGNEITLSAPIARYR